MRHFSLTLCLILTACGGAPDYYEIPAQRAMAAAVALRPESVLHLDDLNADDFIVGGVAPADPRNAWRWSYEKPEFRFPLDPKLSYKAMLDFTIADATFQQTGPLTIRFAVNSQLVANQVFPQPGSYRFEYQLASGMAAAGFLTLSAEIGPVWRSPTDGAKLGVILNEAGFVPE